VSRGDYPTRPQCFGVALFFVQYNEGILEFLGQAASHMHKLVSFDLMDEGDSSASGFVPILLSTFVLRKSFSLLVDRQAEHVFIGRDCLLDV